MTHALVTGATGFIGHHLVQRLTASGTAVTCLVRETSQCSRLRELDVRLVHGDVSDLNSLEDAIRGVDVVYHLAGLTKSFGVHALMEINAQGAKNISRVCARQASPPTLVLVSSLAAAGPSGKEKPRTERDEVQPVSNYGRSKRAGELAAIEYASRVPTTIIRPPVVLGEYDRDGLQWFQMIRTLGFHLIPGFVDHRYSMIHADDLAVALILAADKGRRLTGNVDDDAGIYFATCDEVVTFEDLGRMIGSCVGRPAAWMVRAPMLAIWGLAGCSDVWARICNKPCVLNFDKAKEAAAGSWACSAAKLQRDTGYRPVRSLSERLRQTADWYLEEGWL
ncbi:MAG: SDR family NAD(P)-dependent oxidoreductase [Rubripirellula sp.]|nr:SDR family NAD(P)-dependent oxidoreductase [Rubripirellula sp.]